MAKFSSFSDTFDGNVINLSLWTNIFGTVTASSGAMNIVVNSGTTNYSGVDSKNTFDLTNSVLSVQLVNGGNQALATYEAFIVQAMTGATSKLSWHLALGVLQCLKTVASVQAQVGSNLTYDSTLHKYFRIREFNGSIYWDYSADGVSWTNQTSVATPITITALFYEPTAGTFGTEASGTTLILDNVNIIPSNRLINNRVNSGIRPRAFAPGIAR